MISENSIRDMEDVNARIQALVDDWCERREYKLLAIVLPAWISNNGLTDGWQELEDTLKSACNTKGNLPDGELEELHQCYVYIQRRLRER